MQAKVNKFFVVVFKTTDPTISTYYDLQSLQ